MRYRLIIDHDPDPDMSWLDQDIYDPRSPEYNGPIYPSTVDMRRQTNAYDPDWYRDKANHVSLAVRLYKLGAKDQDWQFADAIGGVDFLHDSDEWATGTFYRLSQVPKGYLRTLARELGMR